jgi:ribosomal protein S18 acetylase RimI-like enzyme
MTPTTDHHHAPAILAMMARLYAEDHTGADIDTSRFPRTIDTLIASPHLGQIILCFAETPQNHAPRASPAGYAIIIPFWSNEFGGTVALLDELYILPEFRGQGLGKGVLDLIEHTRPFNAVAVLLEVSEKNAKARAFYEAIGLHARTNLVMTKVFEPA